MSVLLVNPPTGERAAARIVIPPLGLAYVSASLRSRGIECRVLDADALDLDEHELIEQARRAAARIVGITAMTPLAHAAYRAATLLRPIAPVLVLGGPHVSAVAAGVFAESPVPLDYAVCGEAEESFADLAGRILNGSGPEPGSIPGVIAPSDSVNFERPTINDLDALPFPDRDSLPLRRYRHPLWGNEPVATMITSRGCPYQCIFCDKHTCGTRWRARSAANVLAEMEEVVIKRGIRAVMLYDDVFTLKPERVIEICRGIVERGLAFRWKCEGRVNRVEPEMLAWMRRAGCQMIAYGVETVTESGLKFLRKEITPQQVREAFALTHAAGIQTLGYFLLGIPGETIEDEMATIRFAIELGADYAQFGTLSPFPGTSLYQYAQERGWLGQAQARGPAERGQRPLIFDGYWSLDRLDQITREAHRSFYFRPGYILKRLKRVKSIGEALTGAAQGIKLVSWLATSALCSKNNNV